MKTKILPNFVLARLQNIHVIDKETGIHMLVDCIDIFVDDGLICGVFEQLGNKKYLNTNLIFLNHEYHHQ